MLKGLQVGVVTSLLSAVLLLSGCATAQQRSTFKSHPEAADRLPRMTIVVAPLDAELSELAAGGMVERHEAWTTQAVANLTAALRDETSWTVLEADPANGNSAALEAETADVQALLRAIAFNELMTRLPMGAPFANTTGELTYRTGALPAYRTALGEGGVLFVFVRNSYATAGRKALLAASLIGAGLTGVAIVPQMGSDVASAALVDTEGAVLWHNLHLQGSDPRTREGAAKLAREILSGLPLATKVGSLR